MQFFFGCMFRAAFWLFHAIIKVEKLYKQYAVSIKKYGLWVSFFPSNTSPIALVLLARTLRLQISNKVSLHLLFVLQLVATSPAQLKPGERRCLKGAIVTKLNRGYASALLPHFSQQHLSHSSVQLARTLRLQVYR